MVKFILKDDCVIGITTKGEYFLIDIIDYDIVKQYNWYIGKRGYLVSEKCHKHYILHRIIMKPSSNELVDHINHILTDNRRCNLRICNKSQNMMNQKKTRGTSKYKGVCWDKVKHKWLAQIDTKFIGYFDIEEKAAEAYNTKAKELFGEFAYLNKIEGDN